MLTTFQIILLLLLIFLPLYLVGDMVTEHKIHYSASLIVVIAALCFTFYIGGY